MHRAPRPVPCSQPQAWWQANPGPPHSSCRYREPAGACPETSQPHSDLPARLLDHQGRRWPPPGEADRKARKPGKAVTPHPAQASGNLICEQSAWNQSTALTRGRSCDLSSMGEATWKPTLSGVVRSHGNPPLVGSLGHMETHL